MHASSSDSDAPAWAALLSRLRMGARGLRPWLTFGAGLCVIAVVVLVTWEYGFERPRPESRRLLAWVQRLVLVLTALYALRLLLVGDLRAHVRRYWPELLLTGVMAGLVIVTPGLWVDGLRLYGLFVGLIGGGRMLVRATEFDLSPAGLVLSMFALLIAVGFLLLMLPKATVADGSMPLVDALFTATSAACVTGLVVEPTGPTFTLFGENVILALIQLGGLGVISAATSIAVLFGHGRFLRTQVTLRDIQDTESVGEVRQTLRQILLVTLVLEATGALLMYLTLDLPFETWTEKAYFCVFHAVSAFCNAGFTTRPASLTGVLADDVALNLVFMTLIVLGGVGFVVLRNTVVSLLRRRGGLGAYGVQTRLVWITSAVLILGGAALYLVLEWDASLAAAPALEGWGERTLASFFQSVTTRTAGFNTVDISRLSAAGSMLVIALMFVGASPGSTGGGLKTTNLAVLVLFLKQQLRGKDRVDVFGRSLTARTVQRASTMLLVSIVTVTGVTLLLAALEQAPLVDVWFEATSAFATVGLSRGLTAELSTGGRLLITATMYAGRAGILALAIYLARHVEAPRYQYPEETVMAA